MRGQMLWFNEAKDQGFIMTDDGERLAVERPEGRCARRVVSFEVERSNGSRCARHVAFVTDVAAHRPRIRGRG